MDKVDIEELHRALAAKEPEIALLVSTTLGLPLESEQLREEVAQLIDDAEEVRMEGETIAEWKTMDERFAATPIGRLVTELHQIVESILDAESELDDNEFGDHGKD